VSDFLDPGAIRSAAAMSAPRLPPAAGTTRGTLGRRPRPQRRRRRRPRSATRLPPRSGATD
jgi:hypothetical protein